MKKLLAFILTLLLIISLTACGSSEQKNISNNNTPPSETIQLQPTNTNYTRDFDSATNQTIAFAGIIFQIPKGWTAVESTSVLLQINGMSESQSGPMWLELLSTGMTEADLATDACQQAIMDTYLEMMKESFDDVKITNSSYDTQSQLYFINIEASAYSTPVECGVCAFVEQGNLYVYLVPFMEGDEYDYSLDVQEVVKSVSSLGTDSNGDEIDFSLVEVVSYDSIIAGNHSGKIVALEAIIGSCEYYELLECYWFDLWYWSDQKQQYVNDEGFVINTDNGCSDLTVDPLDIFDSGDRIKLILQVEKDNSFDPSTNCIWFSLIEKGDLDDYDLSEKSGIDSEQYTEITGDGNSDISDITVRFETDYIDGDRLHITVFTKNNSDETFSGNIYVAFYSADGKDWLGSDTIIVDELLPGRESWADISVDKYNGTPKMTVDFLEISFVPIKETTVEVDADATEKTKSSYYWSFDGVSWYDDITDIVVYTDGTCIVTVNDNPKEEGQFYAAVIWSCGNNYGVNEVRVVDSSGEILAVY